MADVYIALTLILRRFATLTQVKSIKSESLLIVCPHVIFILKSPCGFIYVGQTKRNLKLRIAEHKAAVRNENMDYAIVRHYKERNHGPAASLKFTGIERVTPNPRGGNIINQLLKREAYWIYTLNSLELHGLNEALDLSPLL